MSDEIITYDIEIIQGEVLPDNAEVGVFGEVWIPYASEQIAQEEWDKLGHTELREIPWQDRGK